MIKNTEIRVGNWLEWNKKPFKVCAIFRNVTENELWAKDNNELHPIPLTEEILLKFGFKKYRNIGCYDTDKDAFFFESDKISLTIDFILSSSNHYYRSTPVDGAIPLKYLHQLQNLVFSVTGEELEINL